MNIWDLRPLALILFFLIGMWMIDRYVRIQTTCPDCGDQLENNKWEHSRLECPTCDYIKFF